MGDRCYSERNCFYPGGRPVSYRVYGDSTSGNCYKVKLLMGFLSVDCEWIELDI